MHTDISTPTGVTLSNPALFRQACYIDGAWATAASGATISVDNPATGEVVGVVPRLGAAETRQAIDAATRALPAWRKTTAKDRAAVKFADLSAVEAKREDFTNLIREWIKVV